MLELYFVKAENEKSFEKKYRFLKQRKSFEC